MLKHVTLRQVVDGILVRYNNIKFRAVKQLISNVFWDKRAEVDLCNSAQSVSFNELKEIQADVFERKADGLTFMYTRCDICMMNIGKTSLSLINAHSASGENRDDNRLIMFDCSKENYYNHAFHERCLKNKI